MYVRPLLLAVAFPLLTTSVSASEIGTGPAVDPSVVFTLVRGDGDDDLVGLAWRENDAVHAGRLRLADESFVPFATLPATGATNLGVGTGGPAALASVFVTWVDSSLDLVLTTFDGAGGLLDGPTPVASSTQITPTRFASVSDGALLAYSWDEDLYWDPRVLRVTLAGQPLGETIVENATTPEQTLGVSVAASPDDRYGIVYTVSDTREIRLRRFAPDDSAVDPVPVVVSGDVIADYLPLSAAFAPPGDEAFVFAAFPWGVLGTALPDLRFAHAPLDGGMPTSTTTLTDIVPAFPGNARDMVGLPGVDPLVVIAWEEVIREDPETCGCSVPQPIRVEFFAQVVRAGVTPAPLGGVESVYVWDEGDPIGPPLTPPALVPGRVPGHYTVMWADTHVRYRTMPVPLEVAVGEEAPIPSSVLGVAAPNPFRPATTLRYTLPHEAEVEVEVHDVGGRHVVTLERGRRAAGTHTVTWDGRDAAGRSVAPGSYVATLRHGSARESVKLVRLE